MLNSLPPLRASGVPSVRDDAQDQPDEHVDGADSQREVEHRHDRCAPVDTSRAEAQPLRAQFTEALAYSAPKMIE